MEARTAAFAAQPRLLVARTTTPETIPTREGEIEVNAYGVIIVRPLGANQSMVIGKFDVIELARKAWGGDAALLEGLAQAMRSGHRWADDPDEPF